MATISCDSADFVRADGTGICASYLASASSTTSADRRTLLEGIPRLNGSSFAPLATLSTLLDQLPGPWPVLDLQRTYSELWTLLPEHAKAGRTTQAESLLLNYVLRQCKASYTSLLELFNPDSTSAAVIDPESGRSASHREISQTVLDFRIPISAHGRHRPVVAISLPNGPLLAMTVLAVATYYTAAPVAHGSGVGKDQFKADVLQSHSNAVLALAADVDRLGLRDAWLATAGIRVFLVDLTPNMGLRLQELDSKTAMSPGSRPEPNNADDTGILLFTSGTSGTKKLVPLSVHSMVCGVAMVVHSWGLTPSMRCLNQMPLNHVGGLIRNLFAPIFSGGSIICCSGFDANLFWDCVEDHAPTWYYASPSMHQCILEAGLERPESVAKSQIRLICNAAGGLLPSLAIQLRETFSTGPIDCIVLPSYGMTECMPISTPPLDYRLEKTGTSGISVGPEIAILNGNDQLEATSVVGRVCVRGAPVFSGYLKSNGIIDKSCFTSDGWFDTGDMGFLDNDRYLYITGRSKEVINRGGELISPFEVEEAIVAAASNPQSLLYGRISKALAFSVTHDVLQEVVGIAVVTPEGAKRACLRGIQESVKSVLNQVKIPVLIVYMDGGLPTNNNKVLRIKLADRLSLPEISDSTSVAGRYFEAICPPPNTPLHRPIESKPLSVSHACVAEACRSLLPEGHEVFVRNDSTDFYPEIIIAPRYSDRILSEKLSIDSIDPQKLIDQLYPVLDGFSTPMKARVLDETLPRQADGQVDEVMLDDLLADQEQQDHVDEDFSATEATVAKVIAQVLSIPVNELSSSSNFFEIGGDSMGAGRLLNALRKEYPLRLPINVLFANPVISQLAVVIDEKMALEKPKAVTDVASVPEAEHLPGCEQVCSSTNPLLLLIQLLPIVVLWPMKRALTWTVFVYMMTETQYWITNWSMPGRLVDLVVSMAVGRAVTSVVAPLVSIAFKWIVIGQHREGLYPMWGRYHTRWWIVEKMTDIAGPGIFGLTNLTLVWYYRMLGAKIGRNVTIDPRARLGELDLITIGNDVVIEKSTIRPFAVERNTSMYLGRIEIQSKASIGLGAIVAAGTSVPENACIGPNSSSWETADADESNRDLSSSRIPRTHWALEIFLVAPIFIVAKFFTALPWLAALFALVVREANGNTPDKLEAVLIWFSTPTRVGWHYCALAAHASLAPIFGFGCAFVIKKILDLVLGRVQPTAADRRSQMQTFRLRIMESVMPAGRFHKLTGLFGTHYEATSVFARALGAKIGKRVYWPGTGPSIQNFDLLDIGDDVVFGSRSHLVTSDGTGSDFVRIKSGAMVADRVVLLPGSQLGEKTVMGSGALARRGKSYADGTTWVGSKKNDAICLSTEAPQTSGAGHRASQYYETMGTMTPDYPKGHSTATTLVRPFADSESSSMHLVERGAPIYTEVDRSKFIDDIPMPHITTRPIDSLRSSMSGMPHEMPSAKVEFVVSTAPSEMAEESSSPFGRAFYEGKANYRVWGQTTIFLYSIIVAIVSATWWNVASIGAVQIIGHLFRYHEAPTQPGGFLHLFNFYRPVHFFLVFWAIVAGIMTLQAVIVIAFTIAAKWVIMGRRTQGNYDWDKSSYCQRWQLFLKLETFRRRCYGNTGILGLLTGTHYIVAYFRALGANIGADCALFASGNPSLMFTEPDLLTLGDRVAVDDASLVGHINTRGKFDLNPLSVGSRSVLRTGSRLLSGARMEEDSCLLEHTLVMAGDVVDASSTVQGWPAEEFKANRMPTLEVARYWKVSNTRA